MATPAPIAVPPLPVETAEPSAPAAASVFADDRTLTGPPATIARPLVIHAWDLVKARLMPIAAATLTPPSEVDADPPPSVPLPVPPLLLAVEFPNERCSVTCWSTPSEGAVPSSSGAPAALAVASLFVSDEPNARKLTDPSAVTLRSVQAWPVWCAIG